MKIIGGFITGLITTCNASQTVTMAENKRIEASISAETMNRIAATGDRITQIFGDEGTFESQHDEITGQIFLKPTAENGKKNLSVTLITEQGMTQDLTLKPSDRPATTLILKPEKRKEEEVHVPEKGGAYQEQILGILKQAVLGHLQVKEGESQVRAAPDGYHLVYQRSYEVGPFRIDVFEVETMDDTAMEMQEKAFYQAGDLAISAGTPTFSKDAKTNLYIVRRS